MVLVPNQCQRWHGKTPRRVKSAREYMDIVHAYQELVRYGAAAALCGTTPKTVKGGDGPAARRANPITGGWPCRGTPMGSRRAGAFQRRAHLRQAAAAQRAPSSKVDAKAWFRHRSAR